MELSVKRVYATQKEDLKHAEVMTKSHFYERIDKKNSQHITNTLAQHEFVNTCSNDANDFQYSFLFLCHRKIASCRRCTT